MSRRGAELSYYKKDNSTLESVGALSEYPLGVKLVNGNVGFENNVLTLPQWCAFLLPKLI